MNISHFEDCFIRRVFMILENSKSPDYDIELDSTFPTLFGMIDAAFLLGCISSYEFNLLETYLNDLLE